MKAYSAIVIITMLVLLIGCARAEPVEEPKPTPLVIDNSNDAPHGTYYGTVVIKDEGIGYEGKVFIEMDGHYIRVTCMDSKPSDYGDRF